MAELGGAPADNKNSATSLRSALSNRGGTNDVVINRIVQMDIINKKKLNPLPAFLSLILPGLGQILIQGRISVGLIQLFLAMLLWTTFMGWIVHLWSCVDALIYHRLSQTNTLAIRCNLCGYEGKPSLKPDRVLIISVLIFFGAVGSFFLPLIFAPLTMFFIAGLFLVVLFERPILCPKCRFGNIRLLRRHDFKYSPDRQGDDHRHFRTSSITMNNHGTRLENPRTRLPPNAMGPDPMSPHPSLHYFDSNNLPFAVAKEKNPSDQFMGCSVSSITDINKALGNIIGEASLNLLLRSHPLRSFESQAGTCMSGTPDLIYLIPVFCLSALVLYFCELFGFGEVGLILALVINMIFIIRYSILDFARRSGRTSPLLTAADGISYGGKRFVPFVAGEIVDGFEKRKAGYKGILIAIVTTNFLVFFRPPNRSLKKIKRNSISKIRLETNIGDQGRTETNIVRLVYQDGNRKRSIAFGFGNKNLGNDWANRFISVLEASTNAETTRHILMQ